MLGWHFGSPPLAPCCKQSEYAHDERISRNAKYEIQNENDQIPKQAIKEPATSHLGLEHSNFGFVSDFDVRYSDLVAANGRAVGLSAWLATLVLHAMVFGLAWSMTFFWRRFSGRESTGSPFATSAPPPQVIPPIDLE